MALIRLTLKSTDTGVSWCFCRKITGRSRQMISYLQDGKHHKKKNNARRLIKFRKNQMALEIKNKNKGNTIRRLHPMAIQVILFEIDCAIFYTNLHDLFCQFISWTNWVNSGTAKRKLESLQFSTSSSFVKIWIACSCEFKGYIWTFWAL